MLLAVVILGVTTAIGSHKRDDGRNRAKARYFYLKGAVSQAEGKEDAAYEYFKKAVQADPDYADAKYAYGFKRMTLEEDTFVSPEEMAYTLSLMRPLVDSYSRDIDAGEEYAYAAAMTSDFNEALRVYKVMVKENPGLSRLYIPLSYYHMNQGNTDSAVFAIREYERLEGASTESTVRKVSYWLGDNDTLAALAEVKAYADAKKGEPQPLIDQAMIYNLLGQQDSAILVLEDALRQFPDKSEMKIDIAMLYAERGDSAKFHSLFEEAFKGEDMEYEDKMEILNLYTKKLPFGAADYPEGDRLFEYAASLYPNDADFFDQYAEYELKKGNFAGALEREKNALKLNPTESYFLGRILSLSILADTPGEGAKAFEEFPAKSVLKSSTLLITYISTLQVMEEYQKALNWVDTLISYKTPGISLASTLNEAEVVSLLGVYDSSDLFNSGVGFEIAGDIAGRMKRSDDVVRYYENAILLMPGQDYGVLNNYAWYIIETMKAEPGSELFEKAKDMSREALRETENNPSSTYIDTYAWILFKEKNYKDALEYMETALDVHVGEPEEEMLSHYGDILFMNGREEEALENWQKALEIAPDNQLLQKKVAQKTYVEE